MFKNFTSISVGTSLINLISVFVIGALTFKIDLFEDIRRILWYLIFISGGLAIWILVNHTKKIIDQVEAIPYIVNDKFNKTLLIISVTLSFIVLSIDIKISGGIPTSPFASFIASFPIFVVVVLFGGFKLTSSLASVSSVFTLYLLVETLFFIIGIDYTISVDLATSYIILFITVFSNLALVTLPKRVLEAK